MDIPFPHPIGRRKPLLLPPLTMAGAGVGASVGAAGHTVVDGTPRGKKSEVLLL